MTVSLMIVGLSIGLWLFASPSLETAAKPGIWVLGIWLRNLVIVALLAQGLHLVLYRWKWQGSAKKYDPRPYPRKGRMFTFGDQYLDNVFLGARFWRHHLDDV